MTVGSLVRLRNPRRAMYNHFGLILTDHKNGSYLVYFDDYKCRTLCEKTELIEVSNA